MTRELSNHHLLEEFRDAFNVEGLAETRLTCEAKSRILEAAIEKAKWCIGTGCHSQDSISFEQSVLGIRELLTHDTDDPRYINYPPWALNVSRSFFGKICGIVEQNLQADAATLLRPQIMDMPHTLRAIPISDGPSSLVIHNSEQNLPSLLQRISGKPVANIPTERLHPTSQNQSVAATNRVRKRTKESISSRKDKGKRRALREEHAQNNVGVSLEFMKKNIQKGYRVGTPSVERGEAGPSDWVGRCKVRQQLEPVPLDEVLALPPSQTNGLPSSEQVIDGRPNHEVTSPDQNYRQFLKNIMKAHQIALTPSERVRLNLCISLASYMNGVPAIPLIGSAPILQPDSSSNVPSPNSQLVHDCQNGLMPAPHRSVSSIRNYSLCPLVDIARPLEGGRNKPKMTRTQGGNDSRGDVSVPFIVAEEVQSSKTQINSDFDAKVPEAIVSGVTLNHPESPIITQSTNSRLELSGTLSHQLFAAKDVTIEPRAQSASAYIQAPGIQTNSSAAGKPAHFRGGSKSHCEHKKQPILYPNMAMGPRNCASPLQVPLMCSPHLSIRQGISLSVAGPKSMTPITCGPSPRAEDLVTISLPQIAGQPAYGSVLAHIYTNQQQSPVAFPTPSSIPSTLEPEVARIGEVSNDTYDPLPFYNQFPPNPYIYIGGGGGDGPLETQPPENIYWSGNQLGLEP